MSSPSKNAYDILSFDCYGTLVDWESAIVSNLQSVLTTHDAHMNNDVVLQLFSDFEPQEQNDGVDYRTVLRNVLKKFGFRLGFSPSGSQLSEFEECIARSMPFDDTTSSLESLQQHFKLAIISNTDEDLFEITGNNLQTSFDYVVTAESCGTYKPNHEIFNAAFKRFNQKNRVLHVAQSLFHDIRPANELDVDSVWIDRTNGHPGAARQTDATPNWTYSSLSEFTESILSTA